MTYHNFLFVAAVFFALWAVMARGLLTSAIMLALLSVCVSLLLFTYNAPWAAVFELSVCAGLITVLFISAISLVAAGKETQQNRTPFHALPPAFAIFAIAAWFTVPPFFAEVASWKRVAEAEPALGQALWALRQPDLIGQILILAAGVFVIKSIFPKKKAAAAEERKA
jgi:NADH-quinone oxidoreductase subunit J